MKERINENGEREVTYSVAEYYQAHPESERAVREQFGLDDAAWARHVEPKEPEFDEDDER